MNSKILMGAALLLLLAGMVQGFWMGATNDMQLLTVHTTVMLPGFVVLATYGAIYRLWRELESMRAARLQSVVAIVSAVVMIIGSLMQVLAGSIALIAAGSGGAVLGAAMLAVLFLMRAGGARAA